MSQIPPSATSLIPKRPNPDSHYSIDPSYGSINRPRESPPSDSLASHRGDEIPAGTLPGPSTDRLGTLHRSLSSRHVHMLAIGGTIGTGLFLDNEQFLAQDGLLVLVTGASGFVGSHVVDQLLQEGYSVRGAVRSHNVPRVSKSYESFGDRFTTTVIDDLVASDLSEAVTGVDAIIHVASPLAHSGAPQVILDTAVSGTTRILDAALAAGVKKLVITSSMASLVATHDYQKEITVNEKSYNPQTAEDALAPGASGFLVYSISKGLADLAVRDFNRAHPQLDITTIHPSYIYGPLGRGQVYNALASGTNRYVYALIDGAPDRAVGGYDPAVRGPPLNVDVRDVARAHVLALKTAPQSSSDAPKRYIVSSSRFTWKEAVELLAEARPELKGRLPVITGKEPAIAPFATLDTGATEAGLGLKNYIRWQDTILDTIDDMLRVEKELTAQ